MWDAIARARRAASFRQHNLEREGHGLADPIVTQQNTRDYYSAVEKAAGSSVADHFRLFMIPGMDHCGLPAQTGRGITEAGFDPRPTARGYQPGVDGLRP